MMRGVEDQGVTDEGGGTGCSFVNSTTVSASS